MRFGWIAAVAACVLAAPASAVTVVLPPRDDVRTYTIFAYGDSAQLTSFGIINATPNATVSLINQVLGMTDAVGSFTLTQPFELLANTPYIYDYIRVYFNNRVTQFDSIGGTIERQPFTGSVPEPATWFMLVAGVGAVGAAYRRRIKSMGAIAG